MRLRPHCPLHQGRGLDLRSTRGVQMRSAEYDANVWQKKLLTCSCSTVNVAAILAQTHCDMPEVCVSGGQRRQGEELAYFQSRCRDPTFSRASISSSELLIRLNFAHEALILTEHGYRLRRQRGIVNHPGACSSSHRLTRTRTRLWHARSSLDRLPYGCSRSHLESARSTTNMAAATMVCARSSPGISITSSRSRD